VVHSDSTGQGEGNKLWRRITPVGGRGRPVRPKIPLGILIFLVLNVIIVIKYITFQIMHNYFQNVASSEYVRGSNWSLKDLSEDRDQVFILLFYISFISSN